MSDPRARLAELAEAGRRDREATITAVEQANRRHEAAKLAAARSHERLMSWTTWSSLSGCMSLVWWAPLPPMIAMFAVGILQVVGPAWMFGTIAASVGMLLVALVGTLWARRRDIAFRAALPYATSGYAAVLGRPARSVVCILEFTGDPPPPQMFADLLRRLRSPTRLASVDGAKFKVEAEPVDYSLLDDHCRWMPRWFRKFERQVLRPVHAVHPIRAMSFE